MINEMKKVSLVALKGDEDRLLSDLMWLKSVEVSKPGFEGDSVVSVYDCESEIAKVEDGIQALERAIKILSPMRKDKKKLLAPKKSVPRSEIEKPGEKIENAVEAAYKTIFLLKEKEANKAEYARLSLFEKQLLMWEDYQYPLGFSGTEYTKCLTGTFPINADLDKIREKCESISDGAFVIDEINRKDLIYVSSVFHKKYKKEISEYFNSQGFINSNFHVGAKRASEELSVCTRKLEIIGNRQTQIDIKLQELAMFCPDMELAYDVQKTRKEFLENKEKLILTGHAFIITGWTGADKIHKLEKVVSKYECYCDIRDPEEGDDVPIELKNNAIGSPYEMIVGMYAYPKYGSFDPSFWTAIFFSIMIGIIFADAGYGLLFTVIALIYLLKAKPKGGTKQVVMIILYCGICCIVCGVLFGGYFGDLPAQIAVNFFNSHALDHLEIICSPTNDPMTFIIIAVGIGAVHLLTGIIIKMVMEFRRGDWKAAVFDNGSYALIFLGAGIYAAFSTNIGLYIAIFGALMILLFKGRDKKNIFSRLVGGFGGLYGLINYASDLLSYSRLFALALSGAVIAQVVNTLATMSGPSILGFIMFIVVIPLGHLLNIGLSAIGAFVHTLRLQYLEFYGKFFEEGGRKFTPAEPKLKYVTVDDGLDD